jgi:hypothetical protein
MRTTNGRRHRRQCRASGPRWCWKRSSCAIESPRWSVTELVARASDRWDRAALDLALALVVVFASSAGRSLGSLWLAFADRPPRRGDSNSKPSCRVRRHRIPNISLANEENRRDPKQSRTTGEQILSNADTFIRGRIVRQTRAECRPNKC